MPRNAAAAQAAAIAAAEEQQDAPEETVLEEKATDVEDGDATVSVDGTPVAGTVASTDDPTPTPPAPDPTPTAEKPKGRWETYDDVRPNGTKVKVTRNIDTGAHRVEEV